MIPLSTALINLSDTEQGYSYFICSGFRTNLPTLTTEFNSSILRDLPVFFIKDARPSQHIIPMLAVTE